MAASAVSALSALLLFFSSSELACGQSGVLGDAGTDVVNLPQSESGTLRLIDLAVSGTESLDGAAPLSLVPAFSPEIHDYYVRCVEGTNTLTVSMTASPGADSVVLQPSTSARLPKQTVTLSVAENQAIVASATVDGKSYDEYWVRCLPHDFPILQWEPHPEAGAPAPGYYLVGTNWPQLGHESYAMVLDPNGVPVWYYTEPQGVGVYDVESLAKNQIAFVGSPSMLPWELHQLSPSRTTGVGTGGTFLDDHELLRLPNGNYLFYTIPIRTGFDLTGIELGLPDGGIDKLGKNEPIASCKIIELTPAGDPVWQWDPADHFDVAKACTYPQPGASTWVLPDGGIPLDAFHCNAIDVDPETLGGNVDPSKVTGNLLVSIRNMDTVVYVERPSGKVLWKMGGADTSKDDATYVPVPNPPDRFYRQHDARLVPGWSSECGGRGQISMFDDETATPNLARAVIYDVVVGRPGGKKCGAPSAKVAWQRVGGKNSSYMGSFRSPPGATRVIGWGTGNVQGLIFTEVDDAGTSLLDLTFLPGGSSYRALKQPLDTFDLGVLRNTAGVSQADW